MALTLEYDLGFATLTSATSWAHHLNHSSDDLTAVYTNFSFYQSIYGQDPRSFVIGRDELDDKPWSQELRLASKEGGFIDWVGGLFYKNQKTNIQEHEFEPGYLDFYNGCSAIYGQATPTQVFSTIPSYCGVGETAYTPGTTTYVDGIPIVKDQTYIGDFETKYTDLAAFGEITAHLTSAWSLTGGGAAVQADHNAGAADRAAVRRRRVLRIDAADRQHFAQRFLAQGAVEGQQLLSVRQEQSGLCHLVAGVSSRRRQCAAAERARRAAIRRRRR